jgi:hypothetical protein
VPLPSIVSSLRTLAALACTGMLACCAWPGTAPAPEAMFVVMGEHGTAVARVLTSAPACPVIVVDGQARAMTVRAAPATIARRRPHSAAQESEPSAFPVLACEAQLAPGVTSASVQGQALPLPKARVKRIVVIGDTGCRLKKSDDAYQDCNDRAAYPFADVAAAAAAWKPDLVVHVGDYAYREDACPPDHPGCAGSAWGYGWNAWRADFFDPGKALLQAAPWVVARGNHESCSRAGQGFWRFVDPRALLPGRDCNDPADDLIGDYSEPYAVALGDDAQLIVIDSSDSIYKKPKPDDKHAAARAANFGAAYRKLDALSQHAAHNIGVNHHPILAFGAARNASGAITLRQGDYGQQTYYGAINPALLPARIDAMLSGHIHLWEQLSFSSDHPSQFVAGFSGTSEDLVPLPATLPPGAAPAPGAVVEHYDAWNDGFGFMSMERTGAAQWDVKVWNQHGQLQRTCRLDGRKSVCAPVRGR